MQYVIIQVTGDEDPYKGPYLGQTGADGKYSIVITTLKDNVDDIEFKAKIIGGANVKNEDTVEWEVDKDCEKDGAIQVMEIDWFQKPLD